jgi:hypothetical protein
MFKYSPQKILPVTIDPGGGLPRALPASPPRKYSFIKNGKER